jgi:predicted enzyme related to lactoylglutathione lyase
MSSPFVWFHHNGTKSNENADFLAWLLSWKTSPGPDRTRFVNAQGGPFAALGAARERYGNRDEWIPFVSVEDVDTETRRALALGATLLREKSRRSAGEFSVIRDRGGAALALWKKA